VLQVVVLTSPGVSDLCDTGTDLDQATQHRTVGDDLGVVPGVGGRGDRLGQRVQVQRTPHPGSITTLGQLGVDRDRINRLSRVVHRNNRVKNDLVCGPVKVRGSDDLYNLVDGVLRQEHATQDRSEERRVGKEYISR